MSASDKLPSWWAVAGGAVVGAVVVTLMFLADGTVPFLSDGQVALIQYGLGGVVAAVLTADVIASRLVDDADNWIVATRPGDTDFRVYQIGDDALETLTCDGDLWHAGSVVVVDRYDPEENTAVSNYLADFSPVELAKHRAAVRNVRETWEPMIMESVASEVAAKAGAVAASSDQIQTINNEIARLGSHSKTNPAETVDNIVEAAKTPDVPSASSDAVGDGDGTESDTDGEGQDGGGSDE